MLAGLTTSTPILKHFITTNCNREPNQIPCIKSSPTQSLPVGGNQYQKSLIQNQAFSKEWVWLPMLRIKDNQNMPILISVLLQKLREKLQESITTKLALHMVRCLLCRRLIPSLPDCCVAVLFSQSWVVGQSTWRADCSHSWWISGSGHSSSSPAYKTQNNDHSA